ncbi:phage tail sheath family protein [Natrialbaceae archaeon AArc-T1-2]|uniref:phage tail sheath family protein n=1 Tax=Natrialbaceae archaeon AArc-T1-2 TaxID=3053904 RepID=UPI0031F318D3
MSTSTVGFLGQTERGPTEPRLVTSFADFKRTFGGYAQYKRGGRLEGTYLAYAVDGFFRNGGQQAYVGRVVDEEAVGEEDYLASAPIQTESDGTVLNVSAVGPGKWGQNIAIIVEDASNYDEESNDLFRLRVKYWAEESDIPARDELVSGRGEPNGSNGIDDPEKPEEEGDPDVSTDGGSTQADAPAETTEVILNASADVEEVYDDLSIREESADFYETQINGTSSLIEVEFQSEGRPQTVVEAEWEDPDNKDKETVELPKVVLLEEPEKTLKEEEPGSDIERNEYDGSTEKGSKSGLAAFEEIDDISIVCVPDQARESLDLAEPVAEHCGHEDRQDRIGLIQAERGFDVAGDPELPLRSEYAAFYCPWIEIHDPVTGRPKEVPPGGHVAGIYARSDAEHGVHKAPANEVVRGAQGLGITITDAEQSILNPGGINCIRSFRGRGIRVWGARTMASDPSWKYVNVRRLFLYLRESIDEGTQWAVFEPNNEDLWARVRQTITNFLRDVWEDGALMGSTPEEAFYVKCDRSTMTQNDIDNGRLICEIGVAPVKPAEFVIFRISQWTGDE